MDYNLSTAVWVGLIAVAGVAAETGIVMVVYLDEAFDRHMREGVFGCQTMWTPRLLTLLVMPAAYAIWRRQQVRVAMTLSASA